MSASAGRVLAINRGDYNSATAYTPMDKVYYLGSTYICIADSTGNLPTNTTYWQIEAKGVSDASDLDYDNTVSGLTADDVQEAIDELASEKQDNLTFDASPIEDSTNPVTSGGVYTALGNKQDTLTFDNSPTENSANPVKSGGVYSAIDDVQDYAEDNISAIVNDLSAKNLFPYPYEETTKTLNGVTYTDIGDGQISTSNNASSSSNFVLSIGFILKKGTYIFTGCPQNGGDSKYTIFLYNSDTSATIGTDAGNGLTFTLNADTKIGATIYIASGYGNGLTFKPMIRDARISDPTFAPYAKTNRELTFKSKTIQGAFTSATYGSLFYADISLASYGITKRQIESITISQVDSNYAITATLVGDYIRCWGLGTANFNGVNFTLIAHYYENELY